MFKIYDLNYKKVSFPVDDLGFGLKSLDINIGPIIYENIYTSSSRADQLVKRYPKDRDVSINAMFTSYNTVDWRLKRDRVYSFFRNLGVFYIAESYQPYKLLKVIVDESYEVDRPVIRWGLLEIPLKIIDTPFKQSLHTTLDIDSEGIRWNDKWGYGMGLSSDKSEWKYKFEGIPYNENLMTETYDYRKKSGDNFVIINEGLPQGQYTISFDYKVNTLSEDITSFLLYAGSQLVLIPYYNNSNSTSIVFNINQSQQNTHVYLYGNQNASTSRMNDISFSNIKIEKGDRRTPFMPTIDHKVRFFNASTEKIKLIQQKESRIRLEMKSSGSWVEISDGTTTFKLNKSYSKDDVLVIRGSKIFLNGQNVLQDTNRNYLTAKKGWNNWQIRGLTDFVFEIDFRFLYD